MHRDGDPASESVPDYSLHGIDSTFGKEVQHVARNDYMIRADPLGVIKAFFGVGDRFSLCKPLSSLMGTCESLIFEICLGANIKVEIGHMDDLYALSSLARRYINSASDDTRLNVGDVFPDIACHFS